LSAENLNLGVLSGKVEMNNLQLKKSGLDGLDLPITIEHGSLKKLRLKIPWTALDSKPVRVYLDGVYLQAGPLDISSLSPEDLARMNTAQRRQKLKAAEDAVVTASKAKDAETNKEKAQELSYFQQFGLKIVDNIEIVLTNVHIRYEDSTTFPGKTFSAGVTIDSISLVTTDSNWNEAFVARDFTAAAIQKLGRLENLGLYWNTDCPPLAPLPNNAWEEAMQEMIFKSSWDHRRASASQFREQPLHQRSPKESGLMYLLGVPNNLYVKITHTEACTATTPKINVDIEVSSLELELDKLQYQQLMATIGSFGMLERQKQLAMMRPSKRPTVCPRDWWFYAYKLITGRDISSGGPVSTPTMHRLIVVCLLFCPLEYSTTVLRSPLSMTTVATTRL
jgi:vacuolar protein sorting-associated protein 13A/C